MILIINEEGQQLLVEVKESLNKLGVARVIHSEVAPLENDVEDLHDFTLLYFNGSLYGLDALDMLQELGVFQEHLVTELLAEYFVALFLQSFDVITLDFVERVLGLAILLLTLAPVCWLDCQSVIIFNFLFASWLWGLGRIFLNSLLPSK